jgi:hypothetical protein
MRFLLAFALSAITALSRALPNDHQVPVVPLLRHATSNRAVSPALFEELEELARVVDISYCVGLTSLGISKPFQCLSRCKDFPAFELVTTWNTGPMLSDSCGYIALDHGKQRVVVAFRGTYSIANTVVDLSTVPQEYIPYPDDEDGETDGTMDTATKCTNCTVHMGFHRAWTHTRNRILDDLLKQTLLYPHYQLNLVGHSLGGAVAALAALDLQGRGFHPVVTTFGEPRVGNKGLVDFIDERFNLKAKDGDDEDDTDNDTDLTYRRVTHIDDPVPLLPLSEWGFAMHAGEIYISKSSLSPDLDDLQHCHGDNDRDCIAGQDSTTQDSTTAPSTESTAQKRDLISSVRDEIHDVVHEPWGIPSRYKLWQLFFAHRDYFWRLGLCVPGGDPLGGGGKYEGEDEDENGVDMDWKADLR